MSVPADTTLSSLRDFVGTVIEDRYQIVRVLGRGGMGAVYEAIQLQLDRRVAIKILNPVYMHREDYVARFMQEAKTASRIRHENVVQVLDFGRLPGGSVYSVMELLEGRDLARLLKRETKVPWPLARALLLQAIRGVKAAHAQGVIHRDIKPANLFLARDPDEGREVLKVLDFGVARLQSSSTDTAALTGTADLIGTPAYMAPELARGRRAGPRTEVYSLGVVAYQLLTGQIPFRGDSAFDALFRAATEPTPPLRSHDPSVPPAVEELVLRMLAKDPQQRFADMNELYREVAGIDEHGCPRVGPVTVTGPQPVAEDSGAGLLPSPADTAVSGVAPGTMTIRTLDVLPSRVGRSRRASRGLIAASIGGLALAGMLAVAVPGFDADPPAVADTSIAAAPDPAPPTLAPASTPTPTPSMVSTSPEPTTVEPDAVIEIEDEPEPAKSVAPRISRARGPDPAAAPRPAPPPTDAEVRRRIERRARSRCKAQLAGAPLTVTFGIGHRGEVLAPRGDRPGAATACVIELLKSSRFATGKMRKEALSV